MNRNVTLNINSHVLEQAALYAHAKGTDLSGLVETLLRKVMVTKGQRAGKILPIEELDSRVQHLVGAVHLKNEEVGLDG